MNILTRELEAYTDKKGFISVIYHLLFAQGYQANILYRISHYFYTKKLPLIGIIFARTNYFITNADIGGRSIIGKRLFLPHPTGLVVGESTIIGNNCTILHGVKLGAKHISANSNKKKNRHPQIGSHVMIGCNASILGNVKIPSNSFVPAHSLITDKNIKQILENKN